MREATKRLIFALDVSDLDQVQHYVSLLKDDVGYFKVGMELWSAFGPVVLEQIAQTAQDIKIMLDLKLHDIPVTVARAVRAIGSLHPTVSLLTVHVGDEPGGMVHAQEIAREFEHLNIVGITVLTSVPHGPSVEARTLVRAEAVLGAAHPSQGYVVCSGKELPILKQALPTLACIVPGIRQVGGETQDQKRVTTPFDAIKDGADMIVVGRPIRDAPDPVKAAQEITNQISLALSWRAP